ncbi:MAG: hypothetical protein QME14_05930 [Methanobacteriaceae archaeon]|nr:hypothetical protein [Methanobacteriaceae archaeon]
MDGLILGIICGSVFGLLAAVIMLPMKFNTEKEKMEAILGAFIERFMIGFLIPNVTLGLSPVTTGIILGIFLSLPTAVITRSYLPIIGVGMIGGIIIGFVTQMLVG